MTPRHAPRAKCFHHCIVLFITFDLICNMTLFIQNGVWPFRATTWPCLQGHIKLECVPILSIYSFSFKVLDKKKAKEELGDYQKEKKGPEILQFDLSWPLDMPRSKMFAPLYSTLHKLRFNKQHDYVFYKMTWRGHIPRPYPVGVTSKFRMFSSSSHL